MVGVRDINLYVYVTVSIVMNFHHINIIVQLVQEQYVTTNQQVIRFNKLKL